MADDLVARLKRRGVGRMEYFSMGVTNMSQWTEGDQDCAEAATRITALPAERDALRAALRPFADIEPSSLYADGDDELYEVVLLRDGCSGADLTRNDLLRARSALADAPKGENA